MNVAHTHMTSQWECPPGTIQPPNFEGRRKPEIPEKTCESEHGLGNHLHIQPVAGIECRTLVQGEVINHCITRSPVVYHKA